MPLTRYVAVAFAATMFFSAPALASAGTADLSATNPVITGETRPGAEITYSYTVQNAGPDAADVTVDDGLSDNEQLLGITASQGSCAPGGNGSLCSLGTVAPGASVGFSVRVRLTTAGNYQHTAWVSTTGGDPGNPTTDPNRDNDVGGINFNVEDPSSDSVEGDTPTVSSGAGYRNTQSTVGVDAEVAPYGAGTLHFEYGRTKAFGKKTAVQKVTGDQTVERKAVIKGLAMKTRVYWRAVLVVGGRTYRGKARSATTQGRMLYPNITIKATKRTASSTTYVGTIGDGFADAPGACKGTIEMSVYTEGGDVLRRRTKVNAKACSYRITIPFGTKDARRYGPKGKGVFVQAGFSGTKAVASARSTSDRP